MEESITVVHILKNFAYLAEVVVIVFTGKWLLDFLTSYSLKEEFTSKDNLAVCISSIGFIIGVSIIATAAAMGENPSFLASLLEIATFGFLGIGLLLVSKEINDHFILKHFNIRKELIDDQNAGTGAVLFGTYICSSLIIAGSIGGDGVEPLVTLVFFALGQITMIIFTYIYQYIIPFDLHEEIERDNVAAGVAFGGTFIAIGLLLFKGLHGEFFGWKDHLIGFLVYSGIGFVLLPAVRFLFVNFFVYKVKLDKEIATDQNIGIGIIEACISILASSWIYFII